MKPRPASTVSVMKEVGDGAGGAVSTRTI